MGRDVRGGSRDRASARLDDHVGRLPHLHDAAEVAVVAVAVDAHRDVEVELAVDLVRLRLAQVPRHARAAEHHAGEAPVERLVVGDDADVDEPLREGRAKEQSLQEQSPQRPQEQSPQRP